MTAPKNLYEAGINYVVKAEYFYKGERWYGYRFKVTRFSQPLEVYGATAKDANERLIAVLDSLLGKDQYTIDQQLLTA